MSIRSMIKKIVPPAGRKFYRTISKKRQRLNAGKKLRL
jgi:hypothetical protein